VCAQSTEDRYCPAGRAVRRYSPEPCASIRSA
jgi:hypothetical protein